MGIEKWQVSRAEALPEWTHIGGDMDLDVQCIPDGYWFILRENAEHVQVLSPEDYAEEFGQ